MGSNAQQHDNFLIQLMSKHPIELENYLLNNLETEISPTLFGHPLLGTQHKLVLTIFQDAIEQSPLNPQKELALRKYCAFNDQNTVKNFLDTNKDLNINAAGSETGMTALHQACKKDKQEEYSYIFKKYLYANFIFLKKDLASRILKQLIQLDPNSFNSLKESLNKTQNRREVGQGIRTIKGIS